jgi:hypothetical protein
MLEKRRRGTYLDAMTLSIMTHTLTILSIMTFNINVVERKVHYSALFTNFVGWPINSVSFPLSDVILALQACPLSDFMFYLHSGITNLSLYKH